MGLPQNEVPLALLMFNVGVELGQLLFVVGILLLAMVVKKIRYQWPTRVTYVPAYGIGGLASFWLIERIIGF